MERPPKKEKKPRKKRKGRSTVSIVLPDSILYNSQTDLLRSYLVGEVARAATIWRVDEIIILRDTHAARNHHSRTNAVEYFVRNLEYLETPQYLRKFLFPLSPDLKYAGAINPLDAPHHLRADEDSLYREGVTVNRPTKPGMGSWVNIGLKQECITDIALDPGTRVTVRIDKEKNRLAGSIVSPEEPRERGTYWGYSVRLADNLTDVINSCPYNEPYDLTIGTSDRGVPHETVEWPSFRHAVLYFGGLSGLEEIMEAEEIHTSQRKYFDYYINVCPN